MLDTSPRFIVLYTSVALPDQSQTLLALSDNHVTFKKAESDISAIIFLVHEVAVAIHCHTLLAQAGIDAGSILAPLFIAHLSPPVGIFDTHCLMRFLVTPSVAISSTHIAPAKAFHRFLAALGCCSASATISSIGSLSAIHCIISLAPLLSIATYTSLLANPPLTRLSTNSIAPILHSPITVDATPMRAPKVDKAFSALCIAERQDDIQAVSNSKSCQYSFAIFARAVLVFVALFHRSLPVLLNVHILYSSRAHSIPSFFFIKNIALFVASESAGNHISFVALSAIASILSGSILYLFSISDDTFLNIRSCFSVSIGVYVGDCNVPDPCCFG